MWGNEGFGDVNANSPAVGGFQQSQAVLNEKKRLRNQNMVAVTASQVLLNSNKQIGILSIGDVDVGIVILLGLIRSVEEKNTCITYKLDDGTDVINVKHFIESGGDLAPDHRTKPLPENTHCRVFGHIRTFNNVISIVTLNIRPVTDPNEISGHMLEVMRNTLYFTKHSKLTNTSQQPMDTSAAGVSYSARGIGGVGEQSVDMSSGGGAIPGLTISQRKVYDAIRVCPTDTGISVQDILAQSSGLSERDVRTAIDFLSSEGHVYSTIDDDHYKSTDG